LSGRRVTRRRVGRKVKGDGSEKGPLKGDLVGGRRGKLVDMKESVAAN